MNKEMARKAFEKACGAQSPDEIGADYWHWFRKGWQAAQSNVAAQDEGPRTVLGTENVKVVPVAATPDAPELPPLLAELADMLPKVGEPEATWTMIRTSLARSLLAARQPEPVAPVEGQPCPTCGRVPGDLPPYLLSGHFVSQAAADDFLAQINDAAMSPPTDGSEKQVNVAAQGTAPKGQAVGLTPVAATPTQPDGREKEPAQ